MGIAGLSLKFVSKYLYEYISPSLALTINGNRFIRRLKKNREKPLESMTVDELVEATAKKPQPAPRTRKLEPQKPVEEMSINELVKAAEEPVEEPGGEVKSTREIVETDTSEDEQVG